MKKILSLIVSAMVVSVAVTGCFDEIAIEGNGISRTENRYTVDFKEVSCSGNFEVTILYGQDFDISVEAESNLLPYIKTKVSGNRLEIGVRGLRILDNSLPMVVHIVMPDLTGVAVSGSGKVETGLFHSGNFDVGVSGSGKVTTMIETEKITISVSGSGKVTAEGEAQDAVMTVSGSGEIYSYNMPVRNCRATVSGSGKIYVNPYLTLDAVISGSGSVYYISDPHVTVRLSGSGKVIDAN